MHEGAGQGTGYVWEGAKTPPAEAMFRKITPEIREKFEDALQGRNIMDARRNVPPGDMAAAIEAFVKSLSDTEREALLRGDTPPGAVH